MSDPQQPKETRPHGAAAKGGRSARAAALEKALRENLRRRKAAQPEAEAASARRATDSQAPSRSEALGQNQSQSLHEKAKEKPEEGA